MRLKSLVVGPIAANCYILGDEKSGEGVIIDPGSEGDRILGMVKEMGLSVKFIIATHGHFDHTAAIAQLKKSLDCDFLLHEADIPFVRFSKESAQAWGFDIEQVPDPDKFVKDEDIFNLNTLELKIIHTPGHSPGGISIYLQREKIIFTGDTLFQGSIGRTDLKLGSMDDLIGSIKEKLYILPDDTVVYSGHGDQTTIGMKKNTTFLCGGNSYMDKTNPLKKLKDTIEGSEKLVAFTGAGLSADSGIATYRGAGGVWSKYDPAKYANINYFREDPTYYWRFFKEVRYPMLKPAKPNRAHQVLAQLEKKGILSQVITQNIDGLHQLAGQINVCELHGNTRQIVCLVCTKTFPMEKIYPRLEEEMPPKCDCGGLLKPDVVLFGESLPQEALSQAWQAAAMCDTFLVVGSSLVVYPAAQIPVLAKENGAVLIIINIDPTPLDHLADLVINQNASEVLGKILE